jgi:D-apionolactonase
MNELSAPDGAVQALSVEQLLRGDAPPEDEPRQLRAGPLTAELHGIELAYVRLGDRELIRRIYSSVRDENWDTTLPKVSPIEIEQSDDSFAVSFSARHEDASIAFSWQGRIEGRSDGTISYSMRGSAEHAFRYCRIGFCILQPPEEYCGRPYRAGGEGIAPATGSYPVAIAPQLFRDDIYHPIVPAFTQLEVDLVDQLTVRLDLEGELFEIEDQRNWTDASFKTYCTPAHLGYPFDATAGQRFEQRVTVSAAGRAVPSRGRKASVVEVELGDALNHPVPRIGTTLVQDMQSLSSPEERALRTPGLHHLRIDVDLEHADAGAALEMGASQARVIEAALELAVFASADTASRAGELLKGSGAKDNLARVIVFGGDAEVTPRRVLDEVRRSLAAADITVPIGGGTDLWFAEINRDPPDPTGLDFLSFSITPQVHTFDDISLVETLAVQAEVVQAAQALAPGLPIVVSSVTLRPRNSAVTIDARQSSLFCAAWTAGSIRYLTESGVSAATYYESIGPRGLSSQSGVVYPVSHVLAAAAALGTATPRLAASCDRCRVEVLAATTDDATELLVTNLQARPQHARIAPLEEPAAEVRVLDTNSVRRAMTDPAAFARTHEVLQAVRGSLELELGPYAVAFIRIPPDPSR